MRGGHRPPHWTLIACCARPVCWCTRVPCNHDDYRCSLVKALQFVEKHGEVCPAGWTPGAKTMKADPKGSKEYFSQLQ